MARPCSRRCWRSVLCGRVPDGLLCRATDSAPPTRAHTGVPATACGSIAPPTASHGPYVDGSARSAGVWCALQVPATSGQPRARVGRDNGAAVAAPARPVALAGRHGRSPPPAHRAHRPPVPEPLRRAPPGVRPRRAAVPHGRHAAPHPQRQGTPRPWVCPRHVPAPVQQGRIHSAGAVGTTASQRVCAPAAPVPLAPPLRNVCPAGVHRRLSTCGHRCVCERAGYGLVGSCVWPGCGQGAINDAPLGRPHCTCERNATGWTAHRRSQGRNRHRPTLGVPMPTCGKRVATVCNV